MFQSKTVLNNITLLKSFLRLKFKEGDNLTDHLHKFKNTIDLLLAMKMKLNDEVQAILLLETFL